MRSPQKPQTIRYRRNDPSFRISLFIVTTKLRLKSTVLGRWLNIYLFYQPVNIGSVLSC